MLIRSDNKRTDAKSVKRLKAELSRAFAAPDADYEPLDAEAVIKRNARGRR